MMNYKEYRDKKSTKLIYKIITRPIKIRIPLKYLKENLGAPFVIAFIILLIMAASYLTYKLEQVANELAIYAYYSLVLGAILQFISYLKYGDLKNEHK